MTELKKLLIEFDTLTQKNRGLSLSKQIDLIEQSLLEKYSVTLRNSDSSADNIQPEQSITEEEMMSRIEDMAADLAEVFSDDYLSQEIKESVAFINFKVDLKELFKIYQNSNPRLISK